MEIDTYRRQHTGSIINNSIIVGITKLRSLPLSLSLSLLFPFFFCLCLSNAHMLSDTAGKQ